jgi:NTE family protein
MKIALALSGGGFRATVFHLGVLARLAEAGLLENITHLSTVSGGSLCLGLVYALNDYQWPSSSDFIDKVLPGARCLLITINMQKETRRFLGTLSEREQFYYLAYCKNIGNY